MADKDKVIARLRELLAEADLQVTTERMLRKQLEEEFKTDLSELKADMRAEVENYLNQGQEEGEEEGAPEQGAEEEEEEADAGDNPRASFNGPCNLSPAMQEFLGGVECMSRPQVVKAIWDYIKANNLQNPKNKRQIILDDKLKKIFKPPVNMFTMNKQLSAHVKTTEGVPRGPSKPREPKRKRAKTEDGDEEGAHKRNSGFSKPVRLSDKLAEFVGAPEMSRGDLTKFFHNYFKEHDLKDPADKRFVLCNDALKKLTNEERFQAFSIQKHIAHHIVK